MIKKDGKTEPDKMAQEAVELFKDWIAQVPKLTELKFPRWMGGPIQHLAVFGDASKADMGVAAYADSKLDVGKLASQLIFS